MAQEELLKPFKEFAGQQGDYYAKVFLAIQQARLPRWHVNWAAVICSFAWAKLRGSWLLFWIGFLIDLVVVVQLGTAYRYKQGAGEVQVDIDALMASGKEDLAANKQFLFDRYDNWADNGVLTALIILVLGRLLFGWMADRFYFYQYNKWRVDCKAASGFVLSRVIGLCVIMAMIVPLMVYRSTQFAPEARDCVKQSRAVAEGADISFKDRFDCAIISDFPRLVSFDRPSVVSFPRDDDGNPYVKVEPARGNSNPVDLFNYSSTMIDTGIGYLTAFYGAIFETITGLLRNLLSALTAIFVGTPWIISMGALIAMSYVFAGLRTTIFVSASLGYLALFGFWAISMETLSLVAASVIICVVCGLPMGVWVGKSSRGRALLTPVLDIMQTIPSFVYLLPAIAFFGIGKPPGILATVIFAMPPMVRLVALGIEHVPESTKEAALAFGANPRQLLLKVELPLALPSIMAGVNQVVMMSLSMVVVAALIGAGGLGAIVTRALAQTDSGKGILAGIGIALLAMMVDRVLQKSTSR